MTRTTFIRIALAGALALALAALPGSASAQKKRGGGGVIRLEETVIEGRVLKPNAFFVSTRTALVYDTMELRESFVGEISKAVEGDSF